jgi:endoplasmic reticulum-Golgi intermediate compartment protein 3
MCPGLYLSTKTVHHLGVDTSRGETINVKLDITFPRMPCDWLSVDAIDASGKIQTKVDHTLFHQRLNSRGRPFDAVQKLDVGRLDEKLPDHLHPEKQALPADYCGSCYGAAESDSHCCNTCASLSSLVQLDKVLRNCPISVI